MRFVDSHTEGEPTRLVVEGGPDLGGGSLWERRVRFGEEFDWFRRAVVLEPRGSDVLVGGLLCEPVDGGCVAGVIFFNNVGFLGMCGHGVMGVVVSLAFLGRIGLGRHRVETPVGVVEVLLEGGNVVTVESVPSYRFLEGVSVGVEGLGVVRGDVAWGGNWFFLSGDVPCGLVLGNVGRLCEVGGLVRDGLRRDGVVGRDGGVVDHVEFFGGGVGEGVDGRGCVVCPGGVYDRSPCGTGLGARLACLAVSGGLGEGVRWVQESVIGSRFVGWYRWGEGGLVVPSVRGRAFVCGEGRLVREGGDPFRDGIG